MTKTKLINKFAKINFSINNGSSEEKIIKEFINIANELNHNNDIYSFNWLNFWNKKNTLAIITYFNKSTNKFEFHQVESINNLNLFFSDYKNYKKNILSSRHILQDSNLENQIVHIVKSEYHNKRRSTFISINVLEVLKEIYKKKSKHKKSELYRESKIFFIKNKEKLEELLKKSNDSTIVEISNKFYDEKFYNWIFWIDNIAKDMNTDWTDIYYFDPHLAKPDHPNKSFFDNIVIYANIGLEIKKEKLFNENHLEIINIFIANINSLLIKIQSINEINKSKETIISHAIKAAISAIMSRNGSHNIGSHILSALSYNINDPADMQVFNKYLQERMDFIAQITTEIPQWTSSMRFINQVMRNFYMQRILLNYIADSEGLSAKEFTGYENESNQKKLQIILVDKDNEPIIPNDNGDGIENDPLVAIPGGATGVHAFYTILENIIRNVSKHSYKEKNDDGKGLKIFIKFEDGNNNGNVDNVEHLKIIIYDNFTKNEEIEIKKENGGTEKKFLKEILENHLYNSFIEEDGSLKYKAWGLAEMKIGAGYLNKKDYSIIGGNEKDKITEFIEIVEVNKEDGKYIGYQIKIPKPKHVLIVDKDYVPSKEKAKKLKEKGIYFEKTLNENTNLDYEFVVLKNIDKTLLEKINSELTTDDNPSKTKLTDKLPARIFTCMENLKNEFIYIPKTDFKQFCLDNYEVEKNKDNLKEQLYQIWVENLITKKSLNPVHLVIKTTGRSNESVLNHSKLLKFIIKEELTQTGINDRDVTSLTQLLKQDKLSKEPVYNLCNAKIKNRILDKFKFYQDLFKKYEENIETLPLNLRHLLEKKDTETAKKSDKLCSDLKNEKIKISIDNYTNKELKDSLESGNKILAYIRHAGFNKKYHYIEALSGSQSYFNEIKNLTEEPDNSLACALIENALLDITLIDERVYKYIEEAGEKVQERFGSIRVSIGNKHNDEKYSDKMIKLFNKKDKKNLTELSGDILIIHQGILDKFSINDKSNEWENLEKNFNYIFVTSGRGQPEKDKFPGYVKFIPFSNIRASLIKQYPEKFILVQNLLKI